MPSASDAVIAALRPDLAVTVITHSPTTAAALLDHPTAKVFILGGWLRKEAAIACGTATAEAAGGVSAGLYLMVPTGIHEKAGLTAVDPDEAALRRLLMSRAASTYVLGSTDKIGSVAPYTVSGLSDVEGIVTDAPSDHPTIQQLRQQEVDILHAT